MMTGDAVVYYPAQSSSALVIYERGHVSAGEIFRFGLWMTLLGWVTVLVVALPWWSLVGEPLIPGWAWSVNNWTCLKPGFLCGVRGRQALPPYVPNLGTGLDGAVLAVLGCHGGPGC